MEYNPDEQPTRTGTIALSAIAGDVIIRPWRDAPAGLVGANIIEEDQAPITLQSQQTLDRPLRGDVAIYIAGDLALKIATVGGDLAAHHLPGALSIESTQGDVTLDDISGPVTLGAVKGDLAGLRLGEDITILSASGDVTLDDVRGVARIDAARGDVNLRQCAAAEITQISGDLRVQSVNTVHASQINGDVTLTQIDHCELARVKGDVTAYEIREHLRIGTVSGDVHLRDLAATVELPTISGDLAAQELLGGITVSVSGDAFLETTLTAGKSYQVQAATIVLRARSPINAQFVAQSNGGEISTHLPLTVERHRQHLAGVIGHGDATVTLTSTNGDIILDAAGAESARDDDADRSASGKHGFRVHIGHGPNGPRINVDSSFLNATAGWPFVGGFDMSSSTPHDNSEMEKRLQDLSERTGRAARKAAEKFREYADRAAARARETDWEAVSRDVRTTIERAVGELESTFREIVAEFEAPTGTSSSTTGAADPAAAKPAAQRIHIDTDPAGTPAATATASGPASDFTSGQEDRTAKRRAILEQMRSGDLTLEEAEEQLKNL